MNFRGILLLLLLLLLLLRSVENTNRKSQVAGQTRPLAADAMTDTATVVSWSWPSAAFCLPVSLVGH